MKHLKPIVIELQTDDVYQSLLKGPPRTMGMRSGRVVLNPGESVGEHSTKEHEEIIIVLEGSGEAFCEGHPPIPISKGTIVYIPPRSTHNIMNTGNTFLKYIYVVAPTQKTFSRRSD